MVCWRLHTTAVAALAVACASANPVAEDETEGSPETTAGETGTGIGETSGSSSGGALDGTSGSDPTTTDSGSEETGNPGCEPEVMFADAFEKLGPPYLTEHPLLPEALFARDRWTQLQHVPPRAGHVAQWLDGDGDGHIAFLGLGQPSPDAAKIDLGRTTGISFVEGDVVHLAMDVWIDPDVGSGELRSTTLIDLEDGDDIMVDGEFPTPGLRVAVDAKGRLMLDRGELPGREAPGAEPVLRLSNLRSSWIAPTGVWFRIEAVVKLGIGATTSGVTIDETFDGDETPGWCELYVTQAEGDRVLVLRMAGATAFDAEAALEVIPREAPEVELVWPELVDFDTFQVGLTNNRSTADERISIDDVELARGC